MLRSILLALDDTPASLGAKRLAISVAAECTAAITGLAVVDPTITAPPEATPVGGQAYKEHKDLVLVERAQSKAAELARDFLQDSQERELQCTTSVVVGDVLSSLIAAADVHDAILAGIDTAFDDTSSGRVSALVERLLRENPRPVIVCPKEPQFGKRTLVAYDGSVPAMRAMQLFCCLGLRKDAETLVATIQDTETAAVSLVSRGVKFMRDHGFSASPLPLTAKESNAGLLVKAAMENDAGMIIAGAYGHRGWREWLLGSTTTRLLDASPVPVFIHH